MKYNLEKIQAEFKAKKKQKFLFFWGHRKKKNEEIGASCLSQWWPAKFEIDGTTYFSAEQYMMAEKARLFGDMYNYENIINSTSPGQAKQFGRQVIGFNEKVWVENRYEIVKKANITKFNQNPELKRFLLSTKNKILVEASPVDSIWGIGLSKDDMKSKNPLLWKGLNLLGFALMEVRDIITGENQNL